MRAAKRLQSSYSPALLAIGLFAALLVGVMLAFAGTSQALAADKPNTPKNVTFVEKYQSWEWDEVEGADSYEVWLYDTQGSTDPADYTEMLDLDTEGANYVNPSWFFDDVVMASAIGPFCIKVVALAKDGTASDPVMSAAVSIKLRPAVAWLRLAGDDALGTMFAIVNKGDFAQGGSVVLVTNGGYWDALTATGLAGLYNAPVIMTDGKTLSPEALQLISNLKPQALMVCGGPAAVEDAVVSELAAKVDSIKTIKRFAGDDAVGTACDIYDRAAEVAAVTWSDSAFICTSNGYWDALSAAPISYAKGMPIFLTDTAGELAPETLSLMKKRGVKNVYIVGGKVAIPESTEKALAGGGFTVAKRFAGIDAIETSKLVAEYGVASGMNADNMGIATSGGYWDALAGASLCGKNNAVLVLVNGPDAVTITGFIRDNERKIDAGFVFGGEAAIDEDTYDAINEETIREPEWAEE